MKSLPSCLLINTGAFHTSGGIASSNRLVIKALAEHGCALEIHSLLESDPEIDRRYTGNARLSMHVYGGSKLGFTAAVGRAILSGRFDRVIVDHVNLAWPLFFYRRVTAAQVFVWLHGLELMPPRPDFEGRLGLRAAHRLLAFSHYARSLVVDRFPDLPVVVCEPGMDPIRHPLVLESQAGPDVLRLQDVNGVERVLGDQVVLNVGRMVSGLRDKGQAVLLGAFPALFERFPGVQLVLAGSGEAYERYCAVARGLPPQMQAAIFMPGQVSEAQLRGLYAACAVFAMPSVGEGFGLVFLEAMRAAKPCIGARTGGAGRAVRAGITGWLVSDAHSADEVAEKIGELLADPVKAAAMGQAGFELLCRDYTYASFKQRLLLVLDL